MSNSISSRLLDQRLRNRVIDALETLADGVDGLFSAGGVEYFNQFFDFIDEVDDTLPYDWRALSTYTAAEVRTLEAVLSVMLEALAGTEGFETDHEIAASGWPERVQPIACEALTVMLERGRFDEHHEEREPSHRTD